MNFDVIICGAGPAGLTASLVLSRAGLKVALIDKEESPGKKVCGDAIPAYVPEVLGKLSSDFISSWENCENKTRVNLCRIFSPSGRILDLNYTKPGFICRRSVFDRLLFDIVMSQQGIAFFGRTRVTELEADNQQVTAKTSEGQTFTGALVIGCDGSGSVTARKLAGYKTDLNNCSGAVRAYFRNVKDMSESAFELHFLRDILPGYFWIFPLPDGYANVGLGLSSRTIEEKRINLIKKLKEIIAIYPGLSSRFEAAQPEGIPEVSLLPLGSRKLRISGERFMICGDAASLADPATGEGIGHAVLSGRYAGWQALRCFEKNDFSAGFVKRYDNELYAKLWKHNRRRYMIRKIVVAKSSAINMAVVLGKKNKFVNKNIRRTLEK